MINVLLKIALNHIGFIPQGLVDIKQRPNHLTGQKGLDSNYNRQPTV